MVQLESRGGQLAVSSGPLFPLVPYWSQGGGGAGTRNLGFSAQCLNRARAAKTLSLPMRFIVRNLALDGACLP